MNNSRVLIKRFTKIIVRAERPVVSNISTNNYGNSASFMNNLPVWPAMEVPCKLIFFPAAAGTVQISIWAGNYCIGTHGDNVGQFMR